MPAWRGFFDGAAEPNPGPAAIGAYLVSPYGEIVWEVSRYIGVATNNIAEYTALVTLLNEILCRNISNPVISGDSQLVVNQVNGLWQVKNSNLLDLFGEARRLIRASGSSVRWVPREQNKRADSLSKKALQTALSDKKDEALTVAVSPEKIKAVNLERISPTIFIAHGTEDYAVDIAHNSCSCPAFMFGKTRPCKHLIAALNIR